MNEYKCTLTEGFSVRLAVSMSNGLTLEHIADYYCIKNGSDSAILIFSKLLSKPVLIFSKNKRVKLVLNPSALAL